MVLFTSTTDPELVQHLLDGSVGVLPTDTIYGIVAKADNRRAVSRLYAIKRREGKPGTVVAADVNQLRDLGLSDEHVQAAAHVWPNPVSVVLPAPEALAYLDQGKQSLAVRIPKNKHLRALLEQTGPLLTSSANWPGEPPAVTIAEAHDYFGDELDFYVDGGNTSDRAASTVVRLLPNGKLEVLRQGALVVKEKPA